MKRRLVSILTALCVALLCAVPALYVRSFWAQDGYRWSGRTGDVVLTGQVSSAHGNVIVHRNVHRMASGEGGEVWANRLLESYPGGWYTLSLAETVRPPWRNLLRPFWSRRNNIPGPAFTRDSWYLAMPTWPLVLLALPLPAARLASGLARRRRRGRGLCPRCGYDLRASAGACPECGDANPRATP